MKKSKVIYKVVVPGFEKNFGDLYKGSGLNEAKKIAAENYHLLPLIEKYVNGKFVDVIYGN